MDRMLATLAGVVVGLLLVGVLWLGDLLRHSRQREHQLRKGIRYAQNIIADHVACCRRCSGHGTIATAGSAMKCPACYSGRDFLAHSVSL